jgi:hypothetical protein
MGTIEGIVLNGATDEPQAGVEVILTSGTSEDERDVSETTTTDEDGRYSFTDLATGDDRFYAVDGIFEGGLFPGGAITIPSDTDEKPVIDTTLRVWNTTNDASSIVLSRDSMFLSQEESMLSVVEAVTIANIGTEAYIGRGGGMDPDASEAIDAAVTIGFPLPQGADPSTVRIIDSDLSIPELAPTDFGFGATIAIPPGETRITFSYRARGTGGSYDLSRTALYPTLRMSVYATDPLDVRSNRLTDEGEVEIGEQTYRHHAADRRLDAGDALQVVAIADAGIPTNLVLGMVGALLLIAGLGFLPLLGRKRRQTPEQGSAGDRVQARDSVLRAIAGLDIQRERGEVDEQTWATRRAELKARLLSDEEPQP